jgi:hypothetical protein
MIRAKRQIAADGTGCDLGPSELEPVRRYFKVSMSVAVSVLYVRPLPISKPLNPFGA